MKPIGIVAIIVATGVVVGGSVYAWQKSQGNTQQNTLNSQNAMLQSQKDTLEKSTTPIASSNTTTPDQNSSSSNQSAVSNIFDLATAKVGDKVGTMSIVSIKKAIENNNPLSNDNVRVEFSGQQTVSGDYNYSKDGNDFGRVELLDFFIDPASRANIPQLTSDPTDSADTSYVNRGGTSNISDAKKILGITAPNATGKATIVLDHYVLFRCECDGGGNTFNIVSASNVADDIANWQNFSSKYFTLSFKIPPGFVVNEDQDHIRVSKAPYDAGSDLAQGGGKLDNAFFGLARYSGSNTSYLKETNTHRGVDFFKNKSETSTKIDSASFLTMEGDVECGEAITNRQKARVVFFDRSFLTYSSCSFIHSLDTYYGSNDESVFDRIDIGNKIVSTMKFSK